MVITAQGTEDSLNLSAGPQEGRLHSGRTDKMPEICLSVALIEVVRVDVRNPNLKEHGMLEYCGMIGQRVSSLVYQLVRT